MNHVILLRQVRPMGGDPVDLLIRDGRIAAMESAIPTPREEAGVAGVIVLDGGNRLLLPGLVDAHAHMDKTLMGLPWHANQTPGPRIRDFVDNERRLRRELELSAAEQSARQAAAALAAGTTHIRTHVDIDTDAGLDHFHGILATKAAFQGRLTMQVVAFPQSGLLVRPGTVELLEEALRQGADCMGGLDPSTVDRDPARHLDTIFGLAERYGVEVDIHLHEPGMLGAFAVELIAERTRALGMQGLVTISHCFCLGMVDDAYLDSLIALLLENRITIMSLGSGRSDFPPLKRLRQAGVALCTGTDGIRDTWGPYNSVDMLERVKLLGYRSGLRKDEDVEMLLGLATVDGAARMGDSDYGLAVGKRADLVVVAGDTPTEAVITQPPRTLVMKNGAPVARDGRLL